MTERDKLTRRDVVVRGGQLAAGLAGAGILTGPAAAGMRHFTRGAAPSGHVTWAIESDPTALAPFGVLPEAAHWGNEFMYDSLLAWDKNLNIQPALAESYVIKDKHTIDWTLRKGVLFHNGKELTAEDAHYSISQQIAPPPPGSSSVLSFFPAIAGSQVLNRYKLRMKLKKPDAGVFGWFAWGRWSPIVPNDLYKQINVVNQGIGTGPFKLVSYTPNDSVEYERWNHFWRTGQPYYDQLTLKIMGDEQARIAALRAGAIDGATISADNARSLANDANLKVLRGLTAGFYELQFTVKAGEKKPWSDRRVRQAINMAINRQDLINKIFGGQGVFSGFIPPGYGQWPLPEKELTSKYEKFDLSAAGALMKEAGYGNGFSVTLITTTALSTLTQMAQLLKSQLSQLKIDVNIQATDLATFAGHYGKGTFDWLLNERGMRGDPHGFVAEFDPGTSPDYNLWFSGYKNIPMWRLVGNGQITLDMKKRLPMYKKLQELLLTELLEIPLVVPYKHQVVNKRLQNMYVAYTDFNTGLRTARLA